MGRIFKTVREHRQIEQKQIQLRRAHDVSLSYLNAGDSLLKNN